MPKKLRRTQKMSQITAKATAEINAPANVVYSILADYNQHRHILPPKYFAGLDIEAGGVGAGTELVVHTKALGQVQHLRMHVTEPEPGVVLAETDVDTGMVTTFTVQPVDSSRSIVTIQTMWDAQAGWKGLLERWGMPLLMRHIYRQELRILDSYARQKSV
jgi:hypothetical protein